MRKSLGDYAILIFSILGSLASIFGFGFFFQPYLDAQGVAGVIFLGVIALFFLAYDFHLISKYRKRVRYSEIFDKINIGFSELHSIDRDMRPTPELIIQKLNMLCENVSQAFSTVNGHRIGVCIKFIKESGTRPAVQTLVRDAYSKSHERKTGSKDTINHFIDLNTDFNFIYHHFDDDNFDTSHYYEPNLPTCLDYQNTRLGPSWQPKKMKLKFLDNYFRRKTWPLKYKSTLVTPIIPLQADDHVQGAIRGYLCIDSPRENAFFKEVDIDILKGISDGVYNKIDLLKQLMEQSYGKAEEVEG